jgi:site-specific DNA recombinase
MAEPQVHASVPERKRCAVYTRVSVDDARHEPFSSTDAQFMACHELIASQTGQGWQPSSRLYEDRGYSASHLRRPGIQMLLDDVQAGLVDVVVVHRLDRLTRHAGDMQSLMSVFEQHGVALVCVTQSLDTSSSHGRLALHLWTSFAQFERELIGERIRDKRAAAKRRGLWHGSAAPLGYALAQQRLVVEPQEAKIVRDIFMRFTAQSSVTALLQELVREGIKTKRWKTLAGQPKGGRPFDKNALYKMLNNRVYLGEMHYEGDWHASEHEAIVTPELWAQVHTVMQSRARRTGVSTTPTEEQQFWLKGLLVGSDGRAMTPSLSSSYRGRRYAYYVPLQDIAVGAGASGLPRLAAGKLHTSVWAHLRSCLRNPEPWFEALPPALTEHPTFDRQLTAKRLRDFEALLDQVFPAHQTRVFRQLIEQVVVGKTDMTVRVSAKGIFDLMLELLDDRYLTELRREQTGSASE